MTIAQGEYLDTATGAWLTLLAQSIFQLIRNSATQTVGNFNLTTSSLGGPYTFNAGDLVLTYFDSNNIARVFRSTNTTPVTVNPNQASPGISIQMTADSPGSAWNIPAGQKTYSSPPTLINNTPVSYTHLIVNGTSVSTIAVVSQLPNLSIIKCKSIIGELFIRY